MKNKNLKNKAEETVSDANNPAFIFQSLSHHLLVEAANGLIDLNELVKKELDNRGLNLDGAWVGFKK